VRERFGGEAADEMRVSADVLRSEVWASDRLSGIEGASGKEARRALERAVDQAAKRMGDDPLARRIRKDGRLKDLVSDWLFELYLEETGGDHRSRAKPPVREPVDWEARTRPAEKGFGYIEAVPGTDLVVPWQPEEAAPIPRPTPRPFPPRTGAFGIAPEPASATEPGAEPQLGVKAGRWRWTRRWWSGSRPRTWWWTGPSRSSPGTASTGRWSSPSRFPPTPRRGARC
jgi:hypothetical protein